MPRSSWFFASVAVSQLAFAASAQASVVWRGDFETGDRSQWNKVEMIGDDRLQVVTSPVRQGNYALRAEVRKGDDPINASGNRNELVRFDGASEGDEFYYAWSTLWPSDYPQTATWQVFMQWHHPGCCGAPPVRFTLGCSARDCGAPMPDTLFFVVDGKTVWTKTPVTRGEWHDFILHIKWSANSSVGFVELWYDGELVVPRRQVRTMFSSRDTNYLKMGLYRDEATVPTAALFHDGLVQATTLEEAQMALGPRPTPQPVQVATQQAALVSDAAADLSPYAAVTAPAHPTAGDLQTGAGCGASSVTSALPWAAPLGALAWWRRRRRNQSPTPPQG